MTSNREDFSSADIPIPESSSFLRIADLEFGIESARFVGFLSTDELWWGVRIYARGRKVGSQVWQPYVCSENLAGGPLEAAPRWTDLVGKTISWGKNFNPRTHEIYATIAVFGVYDIYDTCLTFIRQTGLDMTIEWQAKCDVKYSPVYDEQLDLNMKCDLRFDEITVISQCLGEESLARAALAKNAVTSEFVFVQKTPTYYAHFRPITR